MAWFSALDVQALLLRKKCEQSWKPFRQLLDEALQASLDDALICLEGDPIYGPAWLCLARHRISRVDLQRVSWAIALKELVDPSNGVFFSDDPYRSASVDDRQKEEPADETEAFWQAVTAHIPLAQRLQRFSHTWQGDVCRGACELQSFFNGYLDIVQRPLRVPFFLHEMLRASLACIDWHVVAARVLRVAASPTCMCEARRQEGHCGAWAEYLGELCRLVANEIVQHSSSLSEPQRTQALFLADLCRETAGEIGGFAPVGE